MSKLQYEAAHVLFSGFDRETKRQVVHWDLCELTTSRIQLLGEKGERFIFVLAVSALLLKGK